MSEPLHPEFWSWRYDMGVVEEGTPHIDSRGRYVHGPAVYGLVERRLGPTYYGLEQREVEFSYRPVSR